MNLQKLLVALFLLSALPSAQVQASGGDINWNNITVTENPVWHGIIGKISPEKARMFVLEAQPGGLTSMVVNTSEADCEGQADAINVIFSSSQGEISSLSPGSTGQLDAVISNPNQDGSLTFLERTGFVTGIWGELADVPTVYLNSPSDKRAFKMGFLQDQAGAFVFIAAANRGKTGFDGSPADFQAMLPALGGKATQYYVRADLKCQLKKAQENNSIVPGQQPSDGSPLLANQLVNLGTTGGQAAQASQGSAGSTRQTIDEQGQPPDLAASLFQPGLASSIFSKLVWFGAGFMIVFAFAAGLFLVRNRLHAD